MTAREPLVDPRAHAVIEASAGTGKTYTLEHLVLALLRAGVDIERILVVTFTEKATREMRARVRDRLAEGARAEPVLARALASFDRAPISTIHGFCQRLLSEHAFATGRSFDESRVDGRTAFARALRTVLREARGDEMAVLAAALGVMGLPAIEQCLLSFHRESCPLRPEVSLASVRRALEVLARVEAVEPLVREVQHWQSQARVRTELPSLITLARRAGTEPLESVLPALFVWAQASEGRKRARDRIIVSIAESLAHVPAVGDALATLARTVHSPVPLLVHTLLPSVRLVLERSKRERGLFDYDDLLELVRSALRGPRGEGLVRSVRARYRHALVDEFQDTDERQWEIFRRLFVDDTEPLPPDARPSLVVIGDPKQAIYGFRGADVHTYDRACRELEARGAERAVLDRSHRTSAALLDAMHAVLLPPEGAPPFFTGVVGYPAPVRAAREALRVVDAAGASVPPMRLFHLVSQNELRMKASRRALAAAYAAEIETLLGGAVRVVDERGPRTLDASDVFVLTRTATEGDEIGEALRAHDIPYAFFRKDGLFATDEAKDVLDVLRALVAPRDRRARLRAYATAFFAVPLEHLADAAELSATHGVRRAFERLLELSRRRELAPLLRAMVDETGLAQRELYLHASERRLTNYLHVVEVLLHLSHRGRLSLRDLTEHLAELVSGRARASEDEDIQRLPSERAAVQILTIHKSKGLEAEVVFLYGGLGRPPPSELEPVALHGPASGTESGRYAWAGPLPEAEKARFRLEDEQEAQRLYYVALTRAASLLYLPYVGPRPSASGAGPLEPAVASELRMPGPYRVVAAQLRRLVERGLDPALVARREIDVADAPVVAASPRAQIAPPPPRLAVPRVPATTFAALRHALGGVEVTSYSRMKAAKADEDRRREPALDDAFLERGELLGEIGDPTSAGDVLAPRAAAPDELPGGAAVGVMIHEILEHLPIERVRGAHPERLASEPELLELARDAAHRNGLSASLAPAALAMALRALRTPIEGPGLSLPEGLATPARRLVEVAFVHPIPERDAAAALERGYVRGVVDLLFEHEGRLWVLDWKSDRLERYDAPAMRTHVESSYEVQVRLYTLACARMFGLRDRDAYDARFGGLLYVFARGLDDAGRGALFLRPSFDERTRWERDLASSEAPWGYPLPPRRSRVGLAERVEPPRLDGEVLAAPEESPR